MVEAGGRSEDPGIGALPSLALPEAALTQSRAFFDDPLFRFVFADEAARRERLPWVMHVGIAYGLRFGEVHTDVGAMAGHAVWLPPGETEMTPERMEEVGFGDAEVRMGADALGRFGGFLETVAPFHGEHAPKPHWYLMILGVDPPVQGRGLGGRVIAPVLARADAARVDCYLETANERNLRFYGRHGFDVVAEVDVAGGGPHVWMMLRRAR
jgi:ribosomal protein S18 acetylase RimI-like enzyme